MNTFLLDLLAFGAVLSGILVITAKNPVISVLFLISVFINVAGYLVLLGVAYLGLAYLIIYVGAIAILFLFVIMMLNLRLVELIDTGREYTKNLPLGTIIGSVLFLELISNYNVKDNDWLYSFNYINSLIFGVEPTNKRALDVHLAFRPETNFTQFLQIESIGQGLYTYASLWLVVASVIFLLAMVGPIVLCMAPAKRQAE